MNDGCSTFNVVTFIHDHRADAQTLGVMLQIPASYLLGLSGWETTWGNNRFVRDGNNYFSLHGGEAKPFADGKMLSGDGKVWLSKFPSFLASGQSFVVQYGGPLRGAKTPDEFAQGLIRSGFNSGKAKTGGNPHFVSNTKTAIDMVERRRSC